MARKNTKYAFYVLAGIVLLSLFIYPTFTGKQSYEPVPDTACSNYYYPGDCEAAGCTWTESGCTDGSSGAILFPGPQPEPQPPEADPCVSLAIFECIFTPNCNWDFQQSKCYSAVLKRCFMLDYQECITDPDCRWQKNADGSCDCIAGQGAQLALTHCENCQFEPELGEVDVDCGGDTCPRCGIGKTCEDPDDCESKFCDFIPSSRYNLGQPTFKCKACDSSTADDNIQNCGETGIDCGGGFAMYPCHCFNGVVDPGEAAIDCNLLHNNNKVCPLCTINGKASHCSDGLLNKGESCIDCGGSCNHLKKCRIPYIQKITLDPIKSATAISLEFRPPTRGIGLNKLMGFVEEKGVFVKLVEINKSHGATIIIKTNYIYKELYMKVGDSILVQVYCNDPLMCKLAGYWWCSDKQQCMNQKNPNCYTSKSTCGGANYFWCTPVWIFYESMCYLDVSSAPYYCFGNQADCEGNSHYWNERDSYCSANKVPSYCCRTQACCELNGHMWNGAWCQN